MPRSAKTFPVLAEGRRQAIVSALAAGWARGNLAVPALAQQRREIARRVSDSACKLWLSGRWSAKAFTALLMEGESPADQARLASSYQELGTLVLRALEDAAARVTSGGKSVGA